MRAVFRTKDFRRIEQLPRRDWTTAYLSQIDNLSEALKTPSGTMSLRMVQACALTEIGLHRGLFAPIGVGHGKTLISLLAPHMLGSQRPLLIVPAQLRDITVSKYCRELSEHWQIPISFCDGSRIISYGSLSTKKGQHLFKELNPDLIICDEAHYFKSSKAARTKRFLRYMRQNPDTRFVAMSGTVTKKSIREYWHLIKLALPNGCPLPLQWNEMSDWANALDENVRPEMRTAPGALRLLCSQNETPRDGYRNRLIETPGVLATKESELGTSLIIEKIEPPVPQKIQNALQVLRDDWITPAGEDVSDSLDYYRKARELSFGFYYRWKWNPSITESQKENWLRARSEWRQLVRQESRREQTDTELLVWNAYASGILKRDADIFHNWKTLKAEIDPPETYPVWFCDQMLESLKSRTSLNQPRLIWVDNIAIAQRAAIIYGLPYYGAGKNDTKKLLSHIDTKSGDAIVSIRAHGTGKNLQAYSESLVLTPPGSGATWEQLLGRLHRPGQKSDEVKFQVLTHTKELRPAFNQALSDSSYIETTLGSKQKLSYANIIESSKRGTQSEA